MLYEIKIVIVIALRVLRVCSLFTLVTKQAIELLHWLSLDLIDHINVWIHGLVAAVPGPFHDNFGWYAHWQSVADECPASCMGSHKFPLRLDFIYTLLPPEVGLANHLIDTGKLAKVMQACGIMQFFCFFLFLTNFFIIFFANFVVVIYDYWPIFLLVG